MQIRLADIVGKTIVTCYVPADQKAVTFVLKEGRMSLGAPLVGMTLPDNDIAGAKILTVGGTSGGGSLTFSTDKGLIVVRYEGADSMTELPE